MNKKILIVIEPREQFLHSVGEAWTKIKRGEKIDYPYKLSFPNLETLRKTLTPKRIALLRTIRKQHPQSLYELAKCTGRDIKNIKEDIDLLENNRLIELKPGPQRNALIPSLRYDTLQIEIAL